MKADSLMQLLAASCGLQKKSKHPKSQSKIRVLPRKPSKLLCFLGLLGGNFIIMKGKKRC